MDCVQAQSIISEAMDRQPIDAALLAQAREHCRTCPECAAFVRAQLAVAQTPLPAVPPGLADGVMARIRAEVAPAPSEQPPTAAENAEQLDAAQQAERTAETLIATLAPKPARRKRLPRPWAVGLAAAATLCVLVGVGVLVAVGMRALSGGPSNVRQYTYTPPSADSAAVPTTSGGSSGQTNAAMEAAKGPEYITVNGVVYASQGTSGIALSLLTKFASTTSALGSKNAPILRDVLEPLSSSTASSVDTVYVADDKNQLLAFSRVTRSYLGQTYVLTTTPLTDFGQWPTLPGQLAAPTSADGSPTFTYDGTDSAGVKIYRLANSPVTEGLAIAPSTDANGPMAGDPNWTWWAAAR